MSDNKKLKDGRDDVRVDSNDQSEVKFVHRKYPHLTQQQVMDAIIKVGPWRKAIYQLLDKL